MTQSIRSRFGFSFFANLSKAIITFGTGMLVARGLGLERYDTMMFVLGTFTAVRQLFDVGSSTAFFTFLSQRQRNKRFAGWYFAWLVGLVDRPYGVWTQDSRMGDRGGGDCETVTFFALA